MDKGATHIGTVLVHNKPHNSYIQIKRLWLRKTAKMWVSTGTPSFRWSQHRRIKSNNVEMFASNSSWAQGDTMELQLDTIRKINDTDRVDYINKQLQQEKQRRNVMLYNYNMHKEAVKIFELGIDKISTKIEHLRKRLQQDTGYGDKA